MNSSQRKFYRTTYTFVVLSEEPIPEEMSFMQVLEETYTGHYSGDVESRTDEVTALEMAKLLIEQRSDPEFFGLTPEGDDVDEDAV